MDAHIDSPSVDTGVTPDTPGATGVTAIGANDITTLTIPSATFKTVPYTAVAYDDLSEYDASTGTFTPKHAGDYRVCASLYLTNNFTVVQLDLFKNDVRERPFAHGTGIATGCRVIRLAALDTLQVRASHDSTSNVITDPQPNWQWLTIDRVTAVASVENTAQLTATGSTFTKIPYANEIFDDGSQFDPATNRFAATQAGDYEVCANYDFTTPTRDGEIDLYVNDTRERALSYEVGAINGCRTIRMAAGDNVGVWMDIPVTATMSADALWNWVGIDKQPATSLSVTAINAFTAATHTWVKVPYTTEQFDLHGEFDVGTNTFTASSAGDYQICASLVTFGAGDDEIDIYKNGAREKGLSYGRVAVGGCRTMRLAMNDQIQVWVYTGSNISFTADPNWDWFEVTKVH